MRRVRLLALLPLLLAGLELGPLLLGRGFALVGDMVFVPRQPWKPAWIGADGTVPRAVPSDALTSALTHVLPGDLVQKLVLVLIVAGASAGVLVLTRGLATPAKVVGATIYVWNPYVYDRLAIGHWALLCGYAVLPWVAHLARQRDWRPAALFWVLGLAAWTSPTGGLIAAVVALCTTGPCRRGRRIAGTAVIALVVNLPWLVPGILTSGAPADPNGATAFAARPDTGWGLVGSLLGLGGIWKTSVDPPSRGMLLLSGVSVLIALVAILATVRGARRDRGGWAGLLLLGLASLLVVLGFAWFPAAARWLVVSMPGGGLVRDSQKLLAPLALLVAVGTSLAVDWVAARLPNRRQVRWLALLALLPVVVLPELGWGLNGRLAPVAYPAEWSQAAAAMSRLGVAHDRVLALPLDVYRRTAWNRERAFLDPAPRFFPGQVVTDDALGVRGRLVAGESTAAARLRDAVRRGEPLTPVIRSLGIRWVLIERDTVGADRGYVAQVADQGVVRHRGAHVVLVDLGRGSPAVTRWLGPIAAVDLAVLALGVALGVGGVLRRRR